MAGYARKIEVTLLFLLLVWTPLEILAEEGDMLDGGMPVNVTEDDARINKLVLGLAGSPASFAGYEVAMRWNTQKVPFTGRKHSILIPRWIEESSGVVLLKDIRSQKVEGKVLPPEHFWSRAVANISERIMDAANEGHGEGYQDHMKELTWNIFVIDEPIYNAYAFLGKGSYNIVFYSGLLRELAGGDQIDPEIESKVAFIMAHEVAHVIARHSTENLSKVDDEILRKFLLFWISNMLQLPAEIPSTMFDWVFKYKSSSVAEYEADLIGMHLMSHACFDPSFAGDTARSMKAYADSLSESGASVPDYLLKLNYNLQNTNGEPSSRAQELDLLLAGDVQDIYRERCKGDNGVFYADAGGYFVPLFKKWVKVETLGEPDKITEELTLTEDLDSLGQDTPLLKLACVGGEVDSSYGEKEYIESSIENVKRLLVANADVNVKDNNGWTTLMVAASKGSLECMEHLLAAGAEKEEVEGSGWTALMIAAKAEELGSMQLLLEAGARVNAQANNGWTPMTFAVFNDGIECIDELLEAGADVDVTSADGTTPLMLAASHCHMDSAQRLLDAGAKTDFKRKDGVTALMYAASNDCPEIIKSMLAKGAQLEATDNDGLTAAMYAAGNGRTKSLKTLLEKTSTKDTDLALVWAASYGHPACVKIALDMDAEVDGTSEVKNMSTPLAYAAMKGHLEVMKLLLAAEADAEIRGEDGRTALLSAVAKNQTESVRLLLENGANKDAQDNKGYTSLMIAVENGELETVQVLLAAGVGLDIKDNRGKTALMLATTAGKADFMDLLIKAGAKNLQPHSKAWR